MAYARCVDLRQTSAPSAHVTGDSDRSTISRLDRQLLHGNRTLTIREFVDGADVSVEEARDFWLSLGLPVGEEPESDRQMFTDFDVEAMASSADLAREFGLSEFTVRSLIKALGYTCDRLSLWQMEALVEDAAERYELDDVSARLVVLDQLGSLVTVLEKQLVHAWRRQMAAIAGRYAVEFGQAALGDGKTNALPLVRSIGFADMVEYTARTANLGSHELAELVHRFETTVRRVVISAGGRVVKIIGDAVMFVADFAQTGAAIALGLADAMRADPQLPDVRVSVCYGRILSRFGDVFGPPANIAARLNEMAGPAQVLTDAAMAAALEHDGRFAFQHLEARDLIGVGEVTPVIMTYASRASS